MLIRKFIGSDDAVLLRRIRTELGPDAVILHTSIQPNRGWFRILQRPRVEIVAGSGFQIVKDFGANGARRTAAPPPTAPSASSIDRIHSEVRELKKMVADQGEVLRQEKLGDVPSDLADEYRLLTTGEVSQRLARSLLHRLQQQLPPERRDRASVRQGLRAALRELLRCADGIALREGRCTRVAFIGPTGVGKTTTIAKLMAIYAHHGREVAVVTNDTYRIAAADQIKRVAQIVGVPIRVCRGVAEITAAVEEFANRDLVLIDTAGRSQKNGGRIRELKEILGAAKVDETHLVLSATTQLPTMLDVVERFSETGFQKIVFTKLDETVKVGLIVDVLSRVQQELSFLTTGQEIPSDIEIADPGRLTSLLLGEEGVA